MRLSEPSCLQPGIRIRGHDQRVLRFKLRETFLMVNNRVFFFSNYYNEIMGGLEKSQKLLL